MKTSARGRALIELREGSRLKAYKDSVGIWTIGVGHTSAAGLPVVSPGLTISQAECDEILSRDLVKFEKAVDDAIKVPMAEHENDAFVSLAFNIGAPAFTKSTVARRFNAGDKAGAAEAFLMWCNAGGRPILLGRRKAERRQFLSGY